MKDETLSTWGHLDTATGSMSSTIECLDLHQPGLTLLCHPDIDRIGERAVLALADDDSVARLSRLEPLFAQVGGGRRRALMDPRLSRQPLEIKSIGDGGVSIRDCHPRLRVSVNGKPLTGLRCLDAEQLSRGVVILMAERVALLLHSMVVLPEPLPSFGLIGESTGIQGVRNQIARVADLQVPCLIRGESGTGKELVASAIHRGSPRNGGPFEAVNMGAMPVSLAASELFGTSKGAFTGANRDREGLFRSADRGTLFLDEIGETPPEIQVLLLRVLETGRIRPVGAAGEHEVDVRLLTATDADLESAIEDGRFRAPLLHRISGFEVRLPPLRDRLDDLGRLLIHFLRQEAASIGEASRLRQGGSRPWLPASLVAQLALHDWPGNVRQLRNVARQLVIGNRGSRRLQLTAELEAQLASNPRPANLLSPESETPPVPMVNEQPETVAASSSPQPAVEAGAAEQIERVGVEAIVAASFLSRDRSVPAAVMRAWIEQAVQSQMNRLGGVKVVVGSESVVGSRGDRGLSLFAFDRPTGAVEFALNYQREGVRLTKQIGYAADCRVGILLAEAQRVVPTAGPSYSEIAATERNLAGALNELALPGQILLTRGAFELAKAATELSGDVAHELATVTWLEHGSFIVDGGATEWRVCEVGEPGLAPLRSPVPGVVSTPERRSYRSPDEVTEEELLEVLRSHAFRLQPTAAALGVARTSLYALIDRSDRIRKAKDLTREQIEAAFELHHGDLDAVAAELEVSRKGLRRRMTRLGFD